MLTLISIHTPLAGSDLSNQQTMQLADIFQSTLPLRGATRQSILGHGAVGISIHTPLAGSDSQTESKVAELEPFQSTLPLRGATDYVNACAGVGGISIHTPLAGSDRDETVQAEIIYISIHTPLAGSDRHRQPNHRKTKRFQSTLPLRGATGRLGEHHRDALISIHTPLAGSDFSFHLLQCLVDISIHTPLAGSDLIRPRCREGGTDFNPHSPCGERQSK